MPRSSAVRSVPLLSRFAPRAGLVTLRQTFVRRCHAYIGRPQNDGWKRSLPLHHSALSDCCERGRCVPAMFDVGVAPPHEEPRSGSSSSAHESTSGRSTKYGSGHLSDFSVTLGASFHSRFLLGPQGLLGPRSAGTRHPLVIRREVAFKAEAEIWFRRRQKTVSIVFRAELSAGTRRAACHSSKRGLRPSIPSQAS